ncbi:hypothetical protein [Methylobacterium sp. J-070]|uniref:hypothetical protein n=1 Tax=Methylobacterium sp. J-070 TaxID=2836650 RepID=UPI001FBB3D8B|nr:hypothetical protein [Methylobacterium sp. J-070]MCJ2049326.1 hypothetical protein [Methylobacterium sp. J-070]
MAIHHPTPPLGGGERPRLPSAQVGPVTQAIHAMRAAEPVKKSCQVGDSTALSHSTFTHGIRALSRTEVETLVEGLIDLLDAWDGDGDREPDVDHEPDVDREPDEQDGCAAEWSGRGIHRFNVGEAA